MRPHDESEPLIEGQSELPRSALAAPPVTPGLQEALFDRTATVVRARQRRRRVFAIARLSVAYTAGVATASLLFFLLSQQPPRDEAPKAAEAAETAPAHIVEHPVVEKEMQTVAYVHPDVLRRQVAGAPLKEQLLLLRTAGDRYLSDLDDVEGALYCYRQLLELESFTQSTVEPGEESWLLARLRRARLVDEPGESNL